MKRSAVMIVAVASFFLCATSASGDVLTGADLFNDPNVSFPTRSPQLVGTSIRFGTGTIDQEILLRLPLFAAGSLSTTDLPANLSFTFNLTRLTGDHDPLIALSDGMNVAGFFTDNNPGSNLQQLLPRTASDAGTHLTNFASGPSGPLIPGVPGIGGSFDVGADFVVDATNTIVTATFLGNSHTVSFPNVLDPTKGLTLLLAINNTPERTQLNSIERQISLNTQPVPEPSSILVWCIAGLGMAVAAWRRRNRAPCLAV